jgi:hypothetical protein
MRRLLLAIALLALGCGGPPAPAPEVAETPEVAEAEPVQLDDLSQLSWMVGLWSGDDCKGTVSEQWIVVNPRLMQGTNRTVVGDAERGSEQLELEARDDGVVYRAVPEGQSPTEFHLVELAEGRAVFANPTHDFPRRISYRRDGESLYVEIEGEIDGVPSERSWAWQLQPDAPIDQED